MIVWGGDTASGQTDTGSIYNPSTDTWSATPLTDAPTGRNEHTAIWTGTEMIVWGGRTSSSTVTDTGSSLLYESVPPTNNLPLSNAGADQSVDELTLVTLDGTGSTDTDSDPITYSWTQTIGTSVTLSDPTIAEPFNVTIVRSIGS